MPPFSLKGSFDLSFVLAAEHHHPEVILNSAAQLLIRSSKNVSLDTDVDYLCTLTSNQVQSLI